MANFAAALVALIDGASGVTSVVGTRIYPFGKTPQDPLKPFLTYQRISGVRDQVLNAGGQTGRVQARYQIDCWAETETGVEALADAVRLAVDGYRGTVGGVTIAATSLDNDQETYDEYVSLHRVIMDFMFTYREAIS